jgi:hypothetical protein
MRIAIGGAVLLVLILCLAYVGSYSHLYHIGTFDGRVARLMQVHDHPPVTAADASVIRPWMTFDYVNHLFGLPQEYLKGALGVTDTRYPHLTIGEFLEHEAPDEATSSLVTVQNAVRDYLTP